MSDYISRFLGYFTKFFKKEKLRKHEQLPSRYSTPLPEKSLSLNPSRSSNKFLTRKVSSLSLASSSVTSGRKEKIRSPSLVSLRRCNSEETLRPATPVGVFLQSKIPISGSAAKKSFSDDCGRKRQDRQKSPNLKPFIYLGHLVKCNGGASKIPVRVQKCFSNLPDSQGVDFSKPSRPVRSRYTVVNDNDLIDLQRGDDSFEDNFIGQQDVSNWIAYRNDTNTQFENIFKMLSKKKHSIGNVIDSVYHCQWMLYAGITVDRNGSMFKQFAGAKVVLTLGEYKFLIDQICKVHDLDYWDVLRKMAAIQEDSCGVILISEEK